MTGTPWYVAFFGDDYLDAYGGSFTPERVEREVAFVEKVLGLQPGDEVLDLCCGHGRHAVPFARDGLRVTGQDLSQPYLDIARRAAHDEHVDLATVCSDMREIPFENHFDAVVNLFSAFGYLESDDEDRKVLTGIQKALKPGGRLLLDLINREWVIANTIPNEWHTDAKGRIYLEHREVDLLHSRNHVTFTIVEPDGTRRESVGHHFRLYTLTEVAKMLESAGLELVTVYGGFEGEVYGAATRRMIVIAKKPHSG